MSAAHIFIAGLPGAGKTTFLAALWYLIRSGEIPTELSFAGLHGIDVKYLNDIQQKWLDAEPMGRTRVSNEQIAEINLKSPAGDKLTMYLPDFAGEGFRRMWEDRRARQSIASTARSSGAHLVMVNLGQIIYPRTTDEHREQLEAMGEQPGAIEEFNPRKCPTDAKIADIVCSLESVIIGATPAKVAICLSAWDLVQGEGKSPTEMLNERLPLVHQMLQARAVVMEYKIYGVSAQGGDYKEKDALFAHEDPANRIKLIDDHTETSDLTRMLAWLIS